jgi:uncharacterized protein (TIGR02147 family)
MSSQKPVLSVFNYIDFRSFLNDYLKHIRELQPAFSFNYLVTDFGFKSRSHLIDIIKGRPLSDKYIPSYLKFCKLDGNAAEYFRAIVGYHQARTDDAKSKCWEIIVRLSPNLKTIQLENEAYEYFSKWYHPVIISILDLNKKERDHRAIAKIFKPEISAVQARHAIATLQKLGFLEWDEAQSEWKFNNKFFSCTKDAHAAALRGFHDQMLKLGTEAYANDFKHQNFSTLTVSVSMKARKDIQEIIEDARKNILDRAKEDSGSEVATQINFQMFDLSKRIIKDNKNKDKD